MFSELGVQVMWAPILVFFQFGFLEDVSELLPDQVFLLFIENIHSLFDIIEPWVVQYLFCRESLRDILLKHVLHEVA